MFSSSISFLESQRSHIWVYLAGELFFQLWLNSLLMVLFILLYITICQAKLFSLHGFLQVAV